MDPGCISCYFRNRSLYDGITGKFMSCVAFKSCSKIVYNAVRQEELQVLVREEW